MPQPKSNAIDKSRQQFLRFVKKSAKQSQRITAKRKKQREHDINKDFAAKGRALKKLGLYNTNKPITIKTMTHARKLLIKKKFNALQKNAKYVETKGRVIRPLQKTEKIFKSGKINPHYKLTDYFHLIRTKKKTHTPSGTIKTTKGVLVEKSTPNEKVRINNKGEIVGTYTTKKGHKIKTRRTGIKDEKLLKFINQVEKGKFKLKDNQTLIVKNWGNELGSTFYSSDSLDALLDNMASYQNKMTSNVFNSWINQSEIVIQTEQ